MYIFEEKLYVQQSVEQFCVKAVDAMLRIFTSMVENQAIGIWTSVNVWFDKDEVYIRM